MVVGPGLAAARRSGIPCSAAPPYLDYRGMKRETLKGHLDLLLLATVQSGPVHGYAICEALRRRSDGEIDVPEGSLYPALHRLESDRLLGSEWSVVDGRRRRVYHLTERGREALGERKTQWRRFSRAISAVAEGAG